MLFCARRARACKRARRRELVRRRGCGAPPFGSPRADRRLPRVRSLARSDVTPAAVAAAAAVAKAVAVAKAHARARAQNAHVA